MEALADMDAVPSWSPLHKRVEVVDRYPDGLPRHVRMTLRVSGIADTEMVEYHWGPDWMVWDAQKTSQQHAQHGEYNLEREADDKTRVRFSLTIELRAPLPRVLGEVGGQQNPLRGAGGLAKACDAAGKLYLASSLSVPSRLIASSSVSSRLQKVKRTK